jgi:hypothetical protein
MRLAGIEVFAVSRLLYARRCHVCHFARCDEFDTASVLPANDTAVQASYRVTKDTGKRR